MNEVQMPFSCFACRTLVYIRGSVVVVVAAVVVVVAVVVNGHILSSKKRSAFLFLFFFCICASVWCQRRKKMLSTDIKESAMFVCDIRIPEAVKTLRLAALDV